MNARIFRLLGAALLLPLALAAGPAGAQEFTHEGHAKADMVDCALCHKPGARSVVPAKTACLECHSESEVAKHTYGKLKSHGPFWVGEHERWAQASNANCSSCHEQKFCLDCHQGDPKLHRPQGHLADFIEIHPIRAWGNDDSCRKCHETSFCADCHNRFKGEDLKVKSHRRGWSDLTTRSGGPRHEQFTLESCRQCHPGGILPKHEWTADHAREARRSLTSCQSCHPQGKECLKCHSALTGLKANPHPKNWSSKHERLAKAGDEKSCKNCHQPKNRDPLCQRCH